LLRDSFFAGQGKYCLIQITQIIGIKEEVQAKKKELSPRARVTQIKKNSRDKKTRGDTSS